MKDVFYLNLKQQEVSSLPSRSFLELRSWSADGSGSAPLAAPSAPIMSAAAVASSGLPAVQHHIRKQQRHISLSQPNQSPFPVGFTPELPRRSEPLPVGLTGPLGQNWLKITELLENVLRFCCFIPMRFLVVAGFSCCAAFCQQMAPLQQKSGRSAKIRSGMTLSFTRVLDDGQFQMKCVIKMKRLKPTCRCSYYLYRNFESFSAVNLLYLPEMFEMKTFSQTVMFSGIFLQL